MKVSSKKFFSNNLIYNSLIVINLIKICLVTKYCLSLDPHTFYFLFLKNNLLEIGPGSAPRNVQVRPLSSSTMVIQWDEPEEQNGVVTGYKVIDWPNAFKWNN